MSATHVSEIKAIAKKAHDNETLCEELFADLFGGEREVAVVAAWTLTHLPKEDNDRIAIHREELVHFAITTPDISLRRITLTLLERLEWLVENEDMTPEYHVSLLDFCFTEMMKNEEPYGVRSLCMKIAYKISRPYPELLDELRQSLLLIEPTDLGSGVRHTQKKILGKL